MKKILYSFVVATLLVPYVSQAQSFDMESMMQMYSGVMQGGDLGNLGNFDLGGVDIEGIMGESGVDPDSILNMYLPDDEDEEEDEEDDDEEVFAAKEELKKQGQNPNQARVNNSKKSTGNTTDLRTQMRMGRVTKSMQKKQSSLLSIEDEFVNLIEKLKEKNLDLSNQIEKFEAYQSEGVNLIEAYKEYTAFLRAQIDPDNFNMKRANQLIKKVHSQQRIVNDAYLKVSTSFKSL